MRKITMDELEVFLRKHKLWLAKDPNGERANLCGADLRYADLRDADLRDADLRDANLCGADLWDADLRGANLRGANLCGADLRYADPRAADLRGANLCGANIWDANLRGANLCGANLCGANLWDANLWDANLWDANLCGANLRGANLCGANLRGANLWDADLRGANLFGAKNVSYPIDCPEEGSFVAFKKARNDIIVKLLIPEDAKRCSATSRKCRCNKAIVLEFTNLDGSVCNLTEVRSSYDKNFVYKVGEMVSVDNFDDCRWNECAPGIHFFITRQEAVDY